MSVAVLMQSSSAAAGFHLEKCSWVAPPECCRREADTPPPPAASQEALPNQSDIWSEIQSKKKAADEPYIHPLVRRSSSSLSQESLEICTESLGSETGSGDFSLMDDLFLGEDTEEIVSGVGETELTIAAAELCGMQRRRLHGAELTMSANPDGRRSAPRSFPPPLPSISQRNVPCLRMRSRRVDGRLVVEAVAVTSKNYLHAHRVDGRLLLSFNCTISGDETDAFEPDIEITQPQIEGKIEEPDAAEVTRIDEEEEEEVEEDEEEEVEVVDRGTVIEVKVSTQPPQQQQSGATKVHRSSIVINKFVGGTPLGITTAGTEPPVLPEHGNDDENLIDCNHTVPSAAALRRTLPTTTTAAAAAVAASMLSATTSTAAGYSCDAPLDSKLLFTSKQRNREELLHNMRRCSQLRRRPLFIWEPCCIATSS